MKMAKLECTNKKFIYQQNKGSIMKKFFSVIFIVLFTFTFVNAQSKMAVGVGGNLALPMGTFGDVANMGFGGGAKFEYVLQSNLHLTGSVQYLMFGAKDDVVGVEWSIIPVLAGAKYYFNKNVYTMGEVGMNFWNTKATIIFPIIGKTTVEASDSDFGFAAGAGYELPMGKNALDFSVKYQVYASSTAAINLGVAYKFGL